MYPDKEQTKNKEEPPDPLDEQLIQTLMNQKSDDETSGSNDDVSFLGIISLKACIFLPSGVFSEIIFL